MSRPISSLAALCFVLAIQPLTAQGGTVTLRMKMRAPDAVAAQTGSSLLEVQMIGATDGRQFMMDIVPNTSTGPGAGMHIKMIFSLGSDSMHMGILMSPEMASSTGMPGMRMDMPLDMAGAGNPMLAGFMDSVGKAIGTPTVRSLGTTATVAGVQCAEWIMIAGTDTTTMCVVPTPPALVAMQDEMKKNSGIQKIMNGFPGLAEVQRTAFGGKPMTPIRNTNSRTGMSMELVSFTSGAPTAATFELPSGLQTMPMPGKPGGGTELR